MTSPYLDKINKVNNALENVYLKKVNLIDELGDILDDMIEMADIKLIIYNVNNAAAQYHIIYDRNNPDMYNNSINLEYHQTTTMAGNVLLGLIPYDFEFNTLEVGSPGTEGSMRKFAFPSNLVVTNKQIQVSFSQLTQIN